MAAQTRGVRIAPLFLGVVLQLVTSPSTARADDPLTASPREPLKSEDWTKKDNFGASVSIDGDTAVVGAPYKTISGVSVEGAAYVFTRHGSTWTQQQELLAAPDGAQDMFGASVAISGDTIAVGSPGSTVGAKIQAGVVYLFRRSGSTWTEEQRISASNPEQSRHFGSFLSLDGSTVVVGIQGLSFPGWAYVFVRSGSTWSEQQRIGKKNGGAAIALQGDTAMLGVDAAVEVFTRSGSVWTDQQDLPPPDSLSTQRFGSGVSLSGDTVFVAGPGYFHSLTDVGGSTYPGKAYVYQRAGSAWVGPQELTATHPLNDDGFGAPVAVANGLALVGSEVFVRTGPAWKRALRLDAGGAASISGNTILLGGDGDPQGAAAFEISGGPVMPPSGSGGAGGGNGDGAGGASSSSGCSCRVGTKGDPAAWWAAGAAIATLLTARRRARTRRR